VDRSSMLRHDDTSTSSSSDRAGAVKVVLLSLDRNRQFYYSHLLKLMTDMLLLLQYA